MLNDLLLHCTHFVYIVWADRQRFLCLAQVWQLLQSKSLHPCRRHTILQAVKCWRWNSDWRSWIEVFHGVFWFKLEWPILGQSIVYVTWHSTVIYFVQNCLCFPNTSPCHYSIITKLLRHCFCNVIVEKSEQRLCQIYRL